MGDMQVIWLAITVPFLPRRYFLEKLKKIKGATG